MVSFKFTGTGITWVTRKGPDQGIASVDIDGTGKGNVDLYATTRKSFSKGYSGLTSKSHTIVITVTGTRNASSTGNAVAIDAFVVGFTTTQESALKVTYGSWMGATSASANGGSYRDSSVAAATASFTFTGTRIDWLTAKGPSAGKARVSIDGVAVATIDLYASSVTWHVLKSFAGLSYGSHTIVVTVLGTKNAASAGIAVIVDAFVVWS
jgi:hypothetical protein